MAAQNDVYTRRINTVISHVRQNLDGDLSLDTLSRGGAFRSFILTEFSNRLRLRLRGAGSTAITEMQAGEAKLEVR